MAHSTEVIIIKSARKNQGSCDWCLQKINKGDSYARWRWYDSGDASTVKVHPECREAIRQLQKEDREFMEWNPGDNPRGGKCGWCGSCEKCIGHKAIINPPTT